MDHKEVEASRRVLGNEQTLRVALAFSGVLGVVWLVVMEASPIARVAAGAVSGLSIVALAWNHRRKAGDANRESEILAERLVEQNRNITDELYQLKDRHKLLDHYFETLMEHIPSNIYFKDLDSKFLQVNQSMAKSFGLAHPADVEGKSDHDFFDREHADPALADEKKIIKTGKGITGFIEHETFADGKEGWVLTTKMPFRDRHGTIIGTFGMSSNVTELVETQNTLERERNVLRSLIDSFPDRIFVRDPGRHYLVVNKAMADWVGAESPESMIGKTPKEFFPQEVVDRGAEEDLEILASGNPILNRDWTFKTQEGEIRNMVTTKVPLLDQEGRSWGIVGMDRDVTEARRARQDLIETEKRLQEMMDNSPAVVYLKDLDGRYLMVNRGYEEMFGIGREDVLGRTDHDFIGDRSAADKFRENDLMVIQSGRSVQMDEELYVEGEPHWYVTARFPLRDINGKVHAVGGISTDITDRKRAEEETRQLNEDLVSANNDLQQAQEQLIQAEKMESVGRLASGVAHEVKNPLAMIGMGLELLARRIPEDDEKGRETIERMKRGIERAKKIVKGLVDFSSARQLALEPKEVNEVVRDSLALVEYQLKKTNVMVAEELADDIPQVNLDATKVEQVIVNLMINAMHAMPEGGQLTLRTYMTKLKGVKRDEGVRTAGHLRAGDRVVRIEIDDTGTGISEENSGKIYDPFFTTKPTGAGTGLGLSVSRKIIELHQGTLDLANRPEGGVRATITLKI
ncbi:PAS domain-containing protein [Haloferula chungangensis]|uniref:histidine kinase n=1 Tax=Haloferula chungangensis TaxID=1048331 RepID=A0ABW2L9V8_9BACT